MYLARLTRIIRRIRARGVLDTLALIGFRYSGFLVHALFRRRAAKRIADILRQTNPAEPVILIKSTLDYDFPYSQRPQHLARALGRTGAVIFFVPRGAGYDRIATVTERAPNVYVTPHLETLLKLCPAPALLVFSTDMDMSLALLNKAWARGVVIYDYIDAIDDIVSSAPVTDERWKLHYALLGRAADTICIASANSLLEDVARHRTSNFALVENGVDMAHFAVRRSKAGLEHRLRSIVDQERPIAGYFGALAQWLDYDLILSLARLRPEINFVMIGLDYDGSVRALEAAPPNVHVLPPVDYRELPRAAIWFDVALLPFKINHITGATSPLKLFEYMALGVPVVSTPIPEAMKYEIVVLGETPEAFSAEILKLLNSASVVTRRKLLLATAAENDWLARAYVIKEMIERNARTPVSPPSVGRWVRPKERRLRAF